MLSTAQACSVCYNPTFLMILSTTKAVFVLHPKFMTKLTTTQRLWRANNGEKGRRGRGNSLGRPSDLYMEVGVQSENEYRKTAMDGEVGTQSENEF